METLISDSLLLRWPLHSISSRFVSTKSSSFNHAARRTYSWNPKPILFCSSTFASHDPGASIFGGWEELGYLEEAGEFGMLKPIHNFLIYFGIDDRKHALPFLLGILAAFAVSGVRFSTLVLLPISVLVFFGGFTMGAAAQAGFTVKTLGKNGVAVVVFREKLKHLETLFGDADEKMSYLRTELERVIEEDALGMGFNDSYLRIVEHVRAVIGEAQNTLADSFSNSFPNVPVVFDFKAKKVNQKSSSKRMALRMNGIDFFQILIGILQEPLIGSKAEKPKDNFKERLGQHLDSVVGKDPSLISDRDPVAGNEIGELNCRPPHEFNPENSKVDKSGMNGVITNDAFVLNSAIDRLGSGILSFDEETDNQSSSLQFLTSHDSFQKIVSEQNFFLDSANDCTAKNRSKDTMYLATESKSPSLLEQTIELKNRAHEHSCRNKSSELNDKKLNGFDSVKVNARLVNHPRLNKQEPVRAKGEVNLPYSSNISIDVQLEQNIKEASKLLKLAREYMMTRASEEKTDDVLYKAADLLSSAIEMRPMSLIAVGQLGNIYLLHGELKLKVTRELRSLLLRSNSLFSWKPGGLRSKKLDNIAACREDIESVLNSVCEECEGLLVEAGRKYRSALSIDRRDVRALYNWGIALCFRAQLIADVGSEASMEADKLYLAAIDKFSAMMSGSNAYASDALYRWGTVLQQRSRLRPKNSRESAILLHQAKSLFEDVLSMGPENKLARDALFSCTSELEYNTQF